MSEEFPKGLELSHFLGGPGKQNTLYHKINQFATESIHQVVTWQTKPNHGPRVWLNTSSTAPFQGTQLCCIGLISFHNCYVHRVLREKVVAAMAYITASVPCVSFVEANPSSVNYVTIYDGPTCSSEVGMQGGQQMLMLNRQCFDNGLMTPVHELLHTLGFVHEHERTLVLIIFDAYLNHKIDIYRNMT